MKRPKRRPARASFARLTPFLRGVIYGLYLSGSSFDEIQQEVAKPDGADVTLQSIRNTVAMCEANGGVTFDGRPPSSARGRPRRACQKNVTADKSSHN